MSCRQVQSHLDDYILNQIDKDLFAQIDSHLKECLDCQEKLEINKLLISALQSNKTPDPGDYYWQQMEDSILAKTIGNENEESQLPNRFKSEPINLVKRYLIPLAASFVLLFGSLVFSDFVQNQPQFGTINANNISNNSDSQIFTAIVSASPGSLGKHLVFTTITSGGPK
ncbi:MAG: zf-HC2 domain-containing protein [candidate division Zixibacteria bacterium]|nr:zf-HC2 domain-containing protein [candidate division Zixibacteria bacterium]